MKKNKGFTLIELLAVIVILAIIALIATPIILNVIDKAKLGSAESSALGYIDAVEKQVMINEMDTSATPITDGVYDVPMSGVTVKGNAPESGWLVIEKGEVTNYSFIINDYIVTKGSTTIKGNTATTKPTIGGPTMVAATTETHKGIVYLDPTDLTKTCNENNSITTTETKTGCMKWYVFDDTGDNYTMILDHNTTARIKWNDANSNVSYESSNLKAVVDDLVTTSKWVVTPRLITADEVNTITGKTGFNSSSTSSWYYLDTKTQTKETFTETTRSKYDWLYNNLNLCKTDSTDYGCTIEDLTSYTGYGTAVDGNTWGYWTSTTVGNAGSGSYVWLVNRYGNLNNYSAYNSDIGVRPVITISKSNIS